MDFEYRELLKAYAELEGEVREYISVLFGGTCELCTSTCCTPDICEESLDSAFLKSVRSVYEPSAVFSDRYGWLTTQGCALKYGRPPVCYGFFCNEIVDSLSEGEYPAIMVLGRIVSWVGDKISGGAHLVEIMNSDSLDTINCDRINKRIEVAHLALNGVKNALAGETIEDIQLDAMQKISSRYSKSS